MFRIGGVFTLLCICPKSCSNCSDRCSLGALLRWTFYNLVHHMLFQSLKLIVCDRCKFNLQRGSSVCFKAFSASMRHMSLVITWM